MLHKALQHQEESHIQWPLVKSANYSKEKRNQFLEKNPFFKMQSKNDRLEMQILRGDAFYVFKEVNFAPLSWILSLWLDL